MNEHTNKNYNKYLVLMTKQVAFFILAYFKWSNNAHIVTNALYLIDASWSFQD